MSARTQPCGTVYLVGAGPGDPGLLTLKGQACLAEADVVLYDYLANPTLLAHAKPSAELIYVGRRGRGAYADQAAITRALIEHAQAGQTVVRLKGGDPFVFGRGGEEAEAVAAAGIPFEIVPGVTAATAVPAYAGIPVTHRTLASTVAFVTGHEDPSKEAEAVEWPKLATANGTMVFFMGMKTLPGIVARLIDEGRSPTTPIALIERGTWGTQRTITGTLQDIVAAGTAAEFEPPTLVVVGEVVRLRERLNWFETKPLFGKRIVVTRARGQAAEFSRLLIRAGADPVECPTIETVPPHSWDVVDGALAEIASFHWLIFTSVNGVGPFMARLHHAGLDTRALAGLTICCIGPRTANELHRHGLRADLVPAEFQAEGILEALKPYPMQGRRVLIPRADVAREILPEQLRALGAEVVVAPVYRTVRPEASFEALSQALRAGEIDMLTFTSSSTVRNFVELFSDRASLLEATARVSVACIGPITAATAQDYGLRVSVQAAENTVPALAAAIVAHYQPA